jgi:hypothetical protein
LRGSTGFAVASAAMPTLDILVEPIFAGGGRAVSRASAYEVFLTAAWSIGVSARAPLKKGARARFIHNFCFCSSGQGNREGNPSRQAFGGSGYFNFMKEKPVRLV